MGDKFSGNSNENDVSYLEIIIIILMLPSAIHDGQGERCHGPWRWRKEVKQLAGYSCIICVANHLSVVIECHKCDGYSHI